MRPDILESLKLSIESTYALVAEGQGEAATHAFAEIREQVCREVDQARLDAEVARQIGHHYKERERYRSDIARHSAGAANPRPLLIVADSLGLPRPTAMDSPRKGAEHIYAGLLGTKTGRRVDAICQRFFTTGDAVDLFRDNPDLGRDSDVVLHLGLNDSARRMFLERQRIALQVAPVELRTPIVEFARKYRLDILRHLPPLYYTPPEQFAANLDQICSLLKQRGAHSIVLTTIILPPHQFWPSSPDMALYFGLFNQEIMAATRRNDVLLFNFDRYIWSNLHNASTDPDGMHLSAFGHRLFAQQLGKLLSKTAPVAVQPQTASPAIAAEQAVEGLSAPQKHPTQPQFADDPSQRPIISLQSKEGLLTKMNSSEAKPELPAESVASDAPPKPEAKVYPSSRAKRPIGISFDEFTRGFNPFSLIESIGVADVTDPVEKIVDLFNRFGIVKLRRVYSAERSRELGQNCIDFSNLKPMDIGQIIAKKKKWATGGAPVLKDKRFWSYAGDPMIQKIIQGLIGERSFEFGTAVAAHYSARGLHRDFRMLVENDESPYSAKKPEKRVIRILHYCGLAGGALGYIPFSHDEEKFAAQSKRIGLSHDTAWFDRHRDVLMQARIQRRFDDADDIDRHICWAHADPGDIIISNSAMLHCGEHLTGPRYFFVSTYAESTPDTVKLATVNIRSDLSKEYYRFMSDQGFKGSDDVLQAAVARDAAA